MLVLLQQETIGMLSGKAGSGILCLVKERQISINVIIKKTIFYIFLIKKIMKLLELHPVLFDVCVRLLKYSV